MRCPLNTQAKKSRRQLAICIRNSGRDLSQSHQYTDDSGATGPVRASGKLDEVDKKRGGLRQEPLNNATFGDLIGKEKLKTTKKKEKGGEGYVTHKQVHAIVGKSRKEEYFKSRR